MKHISAWSLTCILLAAQVGCTRGDGGMILTHDGRMVGETPEVARDEFAWRLARRAEEEAGKGWTVTVAIRELPTFHAVKADEYGWRQITIDLAVQPPAGREADARLRERVEQAVREAVKYRVAGAHANIRTTSGTSAVPVPGEQRYTTVAGDTWAGISTAFYGTPQHWRRIADANPGIDGAALATGTVVVIPPRP